MALLGGQLAGLLEPVRDLAVGRLLQEIAEALARGGRVRHEPALRSAEGRILREGALHLPRRADLAITRGGHTVFRDVEAGGKLSFEPVTIEALHGCAATIAPFRWEAAWLSVELHQGKLDLTPIRRWFLEAFQSRYGELAPDLDGAVHALSGPRRAGSACAFRCDLGSAPVETFADMLEAFARSGATFLHVGDDEGISERAFQA